MRKMIVASLLLFISRKVEGKENKLHYSFTGEGKAPQGISDTKRGNNRERPKTGLRIKPKGVSRKKGCAGAGFRTTANPPANDEDRRGKVKCNKVLGSIKKGKNNVTFAKIARIEGGGSRGKGKVTG